MQCSSKYRNSELRLSIPTQFPPLVAVPINQSWMDRLQRKADVTFNSQLLQLNLSVVVLRSDQCICALWHTNPAQQISTIWREATLDNLVMLVQPTEVGQGRFQISVPSPFHCKCLCFFCDRTCGSKIIMFNEISVRESPLSLFLSFNCTELHTALDLQTYFIILKILMTFPHIYKYIVHEHWAGGREFYSNTQRVFPLLAHPALNRYVYFIHTHTMLKHLNIISWVFLLVQYLWV